MPPREAREAGATVIGLPMWDWTGLTPSPWCSELRWADDYPARMRELLAADAVIALAGGVGTLAEAATVWSALQTEARAARLVLLGDSWRRLLTSFATDLVIAHEDLGLAHHAEDIETAIALLTQSLPAGAPQARG